MHKIPLFIASIFLFTTSPLFAQTLPNDFQKSCIDEQISAHKTLKGKPPQEGDFKTYCTCLEQSISKNATNSQLNELAMNPKLKPEWLKALELKAMKACLASGPKLIT